MHVDFNQSRRFRTLLGGQLERSKQLCKQFLASRKIHDEIRRQKLNRVAKEGVPVAQLSGAEQGLLQGSAQQLGPRLFAVGLRDTIIEPWR